jgi:hypothetical protein
VKTYGKTIDEICPGNPELREVVLAIILFENFNRPRFIRLIERIYIGVFNKPTSIGIMQVTSSKNITDLESVKIGTKTLLNKYTKVMSVPDPPYYWCGQIIKVQCPDRQYIRQVLFILKAVIDNKFASEKDTTYQKLFTEIKSEFGLYD